MVSREIVVRAKDVVLLKGIVEAHDGIAQVHGERGGALVLTAPKTAASSRRRSSTSSSSSASRDLGAVMIKSPPCSP